MSVNYDYVIEKIKQVYPKGGKFLDFGCGAGEIVERGLRSKLDFYGADPYAGGYDRYHQQATKKRKKIAQRLRKIEDGKIPFPDNSFEAVTSNMVFEHVENADQALSEIHRVLKPGGLFLALFPTQDTWWEGHTNLYFVHWMKPYSAMQYHYLKICRALGLGNKARKEPPAKWAADYQDYLSKCCFYRDIQKIEVLWEKEFGETPKGGEEDYMLFRLRRSKRLGWLLKILNNKIGHKILRKICHIRAGHIIAVYKDFPKEAKIKDAA